MRKYSFIIGLLILVLANSSIADQAAPQCANPKASSTCYITETDLRVWQKDKNRILIDIRSEAQRKKLTIREAIPVSLFSLKGKDFYKKKNILIVGDGFNRSQLEEACVELEANGFQNLHILKRGIIRLGSIGWEFLGDVKAKQSLFVISARDLFREVNNRPILLIDLSEDEVQLPLKGLARYVHFPMLNNFELFHRNFIELLREEFRKEPTSSIVLFSDKVLSEQDPTLLSLVLEFNTLDLFLLKGGRTTIFNFAKANQKMLDHLAEKNRGYQCR